jgi:hypothetical protein
VLFVVGWVALAAWFVAWVGDYFGLLTLGSNPTGITVPAKAWGIVLANWKTGPDG